MRNNQFEDGGESSVPERRKRELQEKYPDLFDQNGNIVRGGKISVRAEDETDVTKLMGETHTYASAEGKYEPMHEDHPTRKPTPDDIQAAKWDNESY